MSMKMKEDNSEKLILERFLKKKFGEDNFYYLYEHGFNPKVIGYRIENYKTDFIGIKLLGYNKDKNYILSIAFENNDMYGIKIKEVCNLNNCCCECKLSEIEKCESIICLINTHDCNYLALIIILGIRYEIDTFEYEINKNKISQYESWALEANLHMKQFELEKELKKYKSLYENSQSQIETLKSIINKM